MKKIILLLLVITQSHLMAKTPQFCWADYMYSAYFMPAHFTMYCNDGTKPFRIKGKSKRELIDKAIAEMKDRGYEVFQEGSLDPNTDTPYSFIKNNETHLQLCYSVDYSNGTSRLKCSKYKSTFHEPYDIKLEAYKSIIDSFMASRSFSFLYEAPKAPNALGSYYRINRIKSIRMFGGDIRGLCNTLGIVKPYSLSCY